MKFPIAVSVLERYLPHRGEAIWVERILEADSDGSVTEVTLRAGDPRFYNSKRELRTATFVEWMAQAYGYGQAAWYASTGVSATPARAMLVGVNDFVRFQAGVGATVLVQTRRTHQMGPIAVVEARIESEGRLLARGRLKLFAASN